MCYWYKVLEIVLIYFINKGYKFNHKAEMKIITIVKEMDMSYDFYIKHNMHERKLIMMINKGKTIINKLNRNWRDPLIRKHSHVPFNNY